jgi:glycerol-3-phosphate acyltransferase PlsY
MRRLRDGEWIAGAGAVALLASLFLHWYGFSGGRGGEATAWQALALLDVFLALLALVPLALVYLQATRESPSLPVVLSVFTLLAGLLATLLILYRMVAPPGPDDLVGLEAGAFLGLAAAVVVTAGGWRSLRAEPIRNRPLPPVQDLPAPAP